MELTPARCQVGPSGEGKGHKGTSLTIGWGIVSTGRHPDQKVVPAMRVSATTRLSAVCSQNIERAEAFAQRHEIDTAYNSLETMVKDPNVDAVYICSPNALHAQHVKIAAKAGKHVLVEKPMAVNISQAQMMIQICAKYGVKLGVGFHLRYHPGHQKVRTLLSKHILGTISFARAQWAMGVRGRVGPPARSGQSIWWDDPKMTGGASTLMGTGVHMIDLMHFFFEQQIIEVSAMTDGQNGSHILEQLAVISLRFQDGTITSITCGRRMPDTINDAIIYGSQGRIRLTETLWEAEGGELEVCSETVNVRESYPATDIGMYLRQIEAFNDAILQNNPFHASGIDGAQTVLATEAIIKAARTGRTIKVPHPDPI